MTCGEIWKDFFKKVIVPIAITILLFFIFKPVFTENGKTNYGFICICCGIPFGIRRMFVWIVPHGYDFPVTVGILALNFILGGVIGAFVLAWKLLCAVWYIPLTIYRLVKTSKYDEVNEVKEYIE